MNLIANFVPSMAIQPILSIFWLHCSIIFLFTQQLFYQQAWTKFKLWTTITFFEPYFSPFFFRLLMDGTGNGYKNGKEGANLNPILSMLQANLLRIKVNQPFQRKRSYFKKWKWMKKALLIKDDSTILMLKRYNNYICSR